ncbi:MAG: hypothetical protein V1789_06125 [PVC group bacterium]
MKKNRLKLWTLLIPLVIGALFVALDIWPGKAIRLYQLRVTRSNRELIGEFGEDDLEWTVEGEGYQNRKGKMFPHGRWVETCRDSLAGTWRAEGGYRNGNRDGKWVVTRDGEFFREFLFEDGKAVKILRERSAD